MIKIKVNTIWQGQVAIRDKYLKQAQERQEDILIIHGQEQMLIPHLTAHKYNAISQKPVKDKFRYGDIYVAEEHYLLYYKWKPTARQESLYETKTNPKRQSRNSQRQS